MTVTLGAFTSAENLSSIIFPRSIAVFPLAGTSRISGSVIIPSGRTVTVWLSSGFFQTFTWRLSPPPIR